MLRPLSILRLAMKKFLCLALLTVFVSTASADIQAPPGDLQTPVRKLSRGLSNIFLGWTELPSSFIRLNERQAQSNEIVFFGLLNGLERTGARLGYGIYEVINFHTPLYKGSYRAPYTSTEYDAVAGYEEFPPQIGFISTIEYTRGRTY